MPTEITPIDWDAFKIDYGDTNAFIVKFNGYLDAQGGFVAELNSLASDLQGLRDETEQFRNEAEGFTPSGYTPGIWNAAAGWGNHAEAGYQAELTSGENIKTVGGASLLGGGDVEIVASYADFAALPEEGVQGRLYRTIDDGRLYVWGGEEYAPAGGGGGGGGFGPKPLIDLGDVATAGSETVDIDLGAADCFVMSMQTANTTGTLTLNFINIPDTVGKYFSWHVKVFRAGRKTVAFSPGVVWVGGVMPPRQSAVSGSWDMWMFYVMDNGGIRGMLVDTTAT